MDGNCLQRGCVKRYPSLPAEQRSVSFMPRPGRIRSPELFFFRIEKLLISSSHKGGTDSYTAQLQLRCLKDRKRLFLFIY